MSYLGCIVTEVIILLYAFFSNYKLRETQLANIILKQHSNKLECFSGPRILNIRTTRTKERIYENSYTFCAPSELNDRIERMIFNL
jgi:hypothetical protein